MPRQQLESYPYHHREKSKRGSYKRGKSDSQEREQHQSHQHKQREETSLQTFSINEKSRTQTNDNDMTSHVLMKEAVGDLQTMIKKRQYQLRNFRNDIADLEGTIARLENDKAALQNQVDQIQTSSDRRSQIPHKAGLILKQTRDQMKKDKEVWSAQLSSTKDEATKYRDAYRLLEIEMREMLKMSISKKDAMQGKAEEGSDLLNQLTYFQMQIKEERNDWKVSLRAAEAESDRYREAAEIAQKQLQLFQEKYPDLVTTSAQQTKHVIIIDPKNKNSQPLDNDEEKESFSTPTTFPSSCSSSSSISNKKSSTHICPHCVEFQNEIEELQEELNSTKQQSDSYKSDTKNLLQAKGGQFRKLHWELNTNKREYGQLLLQKEQQCNYLHQVLGQKNDEIGNLKQEIKKKNVVMMKSQQCRKCPMLKNKVKDSETEVQEKSNLCKSIQQQLNKKNLRIKKLEDVIKKLNIVVKQQRDCKKCPMLQIKVKESKAELRDKDEKCNSIQRELDERKTQLDERNSQIEKLIEDIKKKDVANEEQKVCRQCPKLQKRIDERTFQLEERMEECNSIKEKLGRRDAQLKEKKQEIKLLRGQNSMNPTGTSQLTGLMCRSSHCFRKQVDFKKLIDEKSLQLENKINECSSIQEQLDACNQELSNKDTEINQLREQNNRKDVIMHLSQPHLCGRCSMLEKQMDVRTNQLEDKSNECNLIQQQLEQRNDQLRQSTHEINELKEQNEQKDIIIRQQMLCTKCPLLEEQLEGHKSMLEDKIQECSSIQGQLEKRNYQLDKKSEEINEMREQWDDQLRQNTRAINELKEQNKQKDVIISQQMMCSKCTLLEEQLEGHKSVLEDKIQECMEVQEQLDRRNYQLDKKTQEINVMQEHKNDQLRQSTREINDLKEQNKQKDIIISQKMLCVKCPSLETQLEGHKSILEDKIQECTFIQEHLDERNYQLNKKIEEINKMREQRDDYLRQSTREINDLKEQNKQKDVIISQQTMCTKCPLLEKKLEGHKSILEDKIQECTSIQEQLDERNYQLDKKTEEINEMRVQNKEKDFIISQQQQCRKCPVLEKQLEGSRARLQDNIQQFQVAQEQLIEKIEEIEKQKNEIDQMHEELMKKDDFNQPRLCSKCPLLQKKLEGNKAQLKGKIQECNSLQHQLNEMQFQLEKMNNKIETYRLDKQNENIDIMTSHSKLCSKCPLLQKKLESKIKECTTIQQQLEERNDQLNMKNDKVDQLREQNNDEVHPCKKCLLLQKKLDGKYDECSSIQKQLEERDDELHKKNDELKQLYEQNNNYSIMNQPRLCSKCPLLQKKLEKKNEEIMQLRGANTSTTISAGQQQCTKCSEVQNVLRESQQDLKEKIEHFNHVQKQLNERTDECYELREKLDKSKRSLLQAELGKSKCENCDEKDEKVINLQQQLDQTQIEKVEIEQNAQNIRDLQNQLHRKNGQISNLQRLSKEIQERSHEALHRELEMHQTECDLLRKKGAEYDDLLEELESSKQECIQLREEAKCGIEAQTRIHLKNKECEALHCELEMHQTECDLLRKKVSEYDDLIEELGSIKDECIQLREEAKYGIEAQTRIQLKNKECDTLRSQFMQLQKKFDEETQDLISKLESSSFKIEQHQHNESEMEDRLTYQKNEIQKAHLEVQELQFELSSLRKTYEGVQSKLDEHKVVEKECEHLKEKINGLERDVSSSRKECNDLLNTQNHMKNQLALSEHQFKREKEELESQLASSRMENSCFLKIEKEFHEVRSQLLELEHKKEEEKEQLQEELENVSNERDQFRQSAQEVEELQNKVKGFLVLNEQFEEENRMMEAELKRVRNEGDELRKQSENLSNRLTESQEECLRLKDKALRANDELCLGDTGINEECTNYRKASESGAIANSLVENSHSSDEKYLLLEAKLQDLTLESKLQLDLAQAEIDCQRKAVAEAYLNVEDKLDEVRAHYAREREELESQLASWKDECYELRKQADESNERLIRHLQESFNVERQRMISEFSFQAERQKTEPDVETGEVHNAVVQNTESPKLLESVEEAEENYREEIVAEEIGAESDNDFNKAMQRCIDLEQELRSSTSSKHHDAHISSQTSSKIIEAKEHNGFANDNFKGSEGGPSEEVNNNKIVAEKIPVRYEEDFDKAMQRCLELEQELRGSGSMSSKQPEDSVSSHAPSEADDQHMCVVVGPQGSETGDIFVVDHQAEQIKREKIHMEAQLLTCRSECKRLQLECSGKDELLSDLTKQYVKEKEEMELNLLILQDECKSLKDVSRQCTELQRMLVQLQQQFTLEKTKWELQMTARRDQMEIYRDSTGFSKDNQPQHNERRKSSKDGLELQFDSLHKECNSLREKAMQCSGIEEQLQFLQIHSSAERRTYESRVLREQCEALSLSHTESDLFSVVSMHQESGEIAIEQRKNATQSTESDPQDNEDEQERHTLQSKLEVANDESERSKQEAASLHVQLQDLQESYENERAAWKIQLELVRADGKKLQQIVTFSHRKLEEQVEQLTKDKTKLESQLHTANGETNKFRRQLVKLSDAETQLRHCHYQFEKEKRKLESELELARTQCKTVSGGMGTKLLVPSEIPKSPTEKMFEKFESRQAVEKWALQLKLELLDVASNKYQKAAEAQHKQLENKMEEAENQFAQEMKLMESKLASITRECDEFRKKFLLTSKRCAELEIQLEECYELLKNKTDSNSRIVLQRVQTPKVSKVKSESSNSTTVVTTSVQLTPLCSEDEISTEEQSPRIRILKNRQVKKKIELEYRLASMLGESSSLSGHDTALS